MKPMRTLVAACLAFSALGAIPGQAQEAPPRPLTLQRPPIFPAPADSAAPEKPAANAENTGDASAAPAPNEPVVAVKPCEQGLPVLRSPLAFKPGELLEFDMDAMGAKAGKLTMRVQRPANGSLPVLVEAQTNTLFSKVRRVRGSATSYLNPKTLRPSRYTEEAVENEQRRKVNVDFGAQDKSVKVDYQIGDRPKGHFNYAFDKDGLDVAGAIYLIRQLPLKKDLPVCFDVYGIRRMWRMTATVVDREHVSLPLGEFDAWHLAGTAVRLDRPSQTRDVHVWITDDDRRLPLAAVGAIDLGAVRLTLSGVKRPGEKPMEAQGKEDLKW
ncbi:hypothetical protein COCOR_05407 [Corallococcus coralloides DSM 2259]|uniref:DUF3108 domain-containing protein n=1 Tax=Corallococcus coralloides (strain ATCC 25202 / DSM 2259 / NBRC 100086 / M2) TaxID=1144275 RepID=H8MXI9_CORCM|nr:DUF3108 domain-containing protein [Corallococcus coralloides]AFE06352.1 hypothetical protein COCOR_05407 [Corallococcus coralloides DSM 2259]